MICNNNNNSQSINASNSVSTNQANVSNVVKNKFDSLMFNKNFQNQSTSAVVRIKLSNYEIIVV